MRTSSTAIAHPNLALVKYWGQYDTDLNLPRNGSISVNLSGAMTRTTVVFAPDIAGDVVTVNGTSADRRATQRVVTHLDRIRGLAGVRTAARVTSTNDFPMDVGMASSASAFAALSLAATAALGITLSRRELSILARKGSGSACRSIPDGFVEWIEGTTDDGSYAQQLAPCAHWDLRIVSVAFRARRKMVGSMEGHRAAPTSPFYKARLAAVQMTLDCVRDALLARDFGALGMAVEREAISLQAVAMTSKVAAYPWLSGIYYLEPETLQLMTAVQGWRARGLAVYFTLDAGPVVHLLCEAPDLTAVLDALKRLSQLHPSAVIVSQPGTGARLLKPAD